MDAAVTRIAPPLRLTTLLAAAGALRAVGSAVAVRLLPTLVRVYGFTLYNSVLLLIILAGATATTLLIVTRRRHDVPRALTQIREYRRVDHRLSACGIEEVPVP